METAYSIFATKLDGDDHLDLIVGERYGLAALLNAGGGTFLAGPTSSGPKSLGIGAALGDLDRDGRVDFVSLDLFALILELEEPLNGLPELTDHDRAVEVLILQW